MPIVRCNKCHTDYEFKEAWFKKNNPEEFVCRNCKIRIKTQSNTYRKKQSQRSKAALSNPDVKERMSQRATLSNIQNADKISIGVKKYYNDHDNRERLRKRSQEKWKDPEYQKMVSEGLQQKWKDPEYRGKILGSRAHLKKRKTKLEKELTARGLEFKPNFILANYEFDMLINGKYLYDEQPSKEKRLFVGHYFKQYVYIDSLDSIA